MGAWVLQRTESANFPAQTVPGVGGTNLEEPLQFVLCSSHLLMGSGKWNFAWILLV